MAWAMDCASEVFPTPGGPRKQRTAPVPLGLRLRAAKHSMTPAFASLSPACRASSTRRMRFRSIAASLRFVHGRFSSHSIQGLGREALLLVSEEFRTRSASMASRTAKGNGSTEPTPRSAGTRPDVTMSGPSVSGDRRSAT